jgi:hypothetical protein
MEDEMGMHPCFKETDTLLRTVHYVENANELDPMQLSGSQ